MIDFVKKFFSKSAPADSDQKKKEGSHDIRVATCALLMEMASVDGELASSGDIILN